MPALGEELLHVARRHTSPPQVRTRLAAEGNRDSNPRSPVYSEFGPPIAAGCFWSVSVPDPLCGPALFGVDESSRAGVRARPLWLNRRLGDDGRHTFGIDVESEEGQRLVAGVAPLVDEAEGLVDQ